MSTDPKIALLRAQRDATVNIVGMTHPKLPPRAITELRTTAKRAKASVDKRNAMIRYWHSSGYSLRDIADALGTITHSAVARIVKKQDDE